VLLHRNRSQGFVALARTEKLERLVVAVLHVAKPYIPSQFQNGMNER
jgi:hypothetical protein